MAAQQTWQTAPRDGVSSGPRQAAQDGAKTIAITASAQRDILATVATVVTRGAPILGARGFVARCVVGDVDPLGISPQAFEGIEAPRLRRKHVDDEGEKVHQDPVGAIVPLDV